MPSDGPARPRRPGWLYAPPALVVLARLFPARALRDGVTGAPADGWALAEPAGHLLLTPFAAAADWVTCLGARQLIALLAWLLAGGALLRAARGRPWRGAPREAAGAAAYLAAVGAFAAWTVLAPRPVARLERPAGAAGALVLDFHSHTRYSWDGRAAFTPERNMAWHRAAGFDAGFITDHNAFEGARQGFEKSSLAWRATGFRSLRGQELSLHDAHVVVLGARERIDPAAYPGPEGRAAFLRESRSRWGALAVMSLPEYWRHDRGRLEELAAAGAAGFELVNAAPKALDLPSAGKDEVAALCRARGLFLAGVTDNHGWARSGCVWSVMEVPGHAELPPEELERAVLARLGKDGFGAVRIIERAVPRPASAAALMVDPPRGLWWLLRSLDGGQAGALLLWTLVPLAVRRLRQLTRR